MKSYINSLADFKAFAFDREVTLSCPEEYIEKQLKRVTRANKIIENVPVLEKGDVSVIGLESALERYNRPQLTLAVGSGLFDRELESHLIGKAVGETFILAVKGTPVKVTIISGKRTVFPAPTDAAVKAYAATAGDMDGVETVTQFRARVRQQYLNEKKQEVIFGTVNEIQNYVLTHSDWEFDPDELKELYGSMMEDMERMAKEAYNKSFAEMTDAEIAFETELPTREALLDELHIQCERTIATLLFAIESHGMDPGKVSMEQAYGLDLDFLQDYVERSITFTEV